jgi:hypothetical protein
MKRGLNCELKVGDWAGDWTGLEAGNWRLVWRLGSRLGVEEYGLGVKQEVVRLKVEMGVKSRLEVGI